jgi:hypothetical protein
VHEKIKTNFLLEFNDEFDFLLDEFIVLIRSDLTLAKPGTSVTNFLGLLWKVSERRYRRRMIKCSQGMSQWLLLGTWEG